MQNLIDINERFQSLSTPLIADACLRLKIPFKIADSGIKPIISGIKIAGRVRPVRHFGSVDVFLEAMELARNKEVLVIDNQGKTDEACIGDLTALEAQTSNLIGMIVWGFHRDTADLIQIGYPVFTYGAYPSGPQRLDTQDGDALTYANFCGFKVSDDNIVFADDDGVLFTSLEHLDEILKTAEEIHKTERRQAEEIIAGNTIRKQLKFDLYLKNRQEDSSYSFRDHLKSIGGAIEE